MSATLLLGIDIGTSSSKGVLVTPNGEIVARAARPHRTDSPRPGWFEHDAERVWWGDFVALAAELVARAGDAEIAGVGVSGIGPCLLAADARGRPLRPAILYGVDTRAGAQIAELDAELGADAILARAGSALTSQAVGPKLLWLRRHEPDVYRRTRMLLMASSALVHRLTGRYVLDHHSASQCTPMYDLAARTWYAPWCAEIAPGLPLPELVEPSEVVGRVSAPAAAATGLKAGTPVSGGTIDAWAEAASVGVRAPGDVMIMYGTTMFLIEVVSALTTHPGLWGTSGVWPNSYNVAGTLPTSGALTSWLTELTSADHATLFAEAEQSPPGARGLLVLPHFEGERTPRFDADARGAIAGLSLAHTRGDIFRAALEGVAFGVRDLLETMAAASSAGHPTRLVAVGGGTQGGLWTQIVSDVTGRRQRLPAETIGACLGDALLAGVATGTVVDPDSWNAEARTVEPDPERVAFYRAQHERYQRLGAALRDLSHDLAATAKEHT